MKSSERDPRGLDPNTPGAKLDDGKIRAWLVLGGFSRALEEVGRVGTFGAVKYSPNGWEQVPNAYERYHDAQMRHLLATRREDYDKDSGLLHLSHAAWNALAVLEIRLREEEFVKEVTG